MCQNSHCLTDNLGVRVLLSSSIFELITTSFLWCLSPLYIPCIATKSFNLCCHQQSRSFSVSLVLWVTKVLVTECPWGRGGLGNFKLFLFRPMSDLTRLGKVCLKTVTVMILSFWTDMPGQTVQTQIRLEEQSGSGSTLFAIPSASFGLITLW